MGAMERQLEGLLEFCAPLKQVKEVKIFESESDSLFATMKQAMGTRKRYSEGKIPDFKKNDAVDVVNKLIEMADPSEQPAMTDDKQYFGTKGKDQFYIAFDLSEDGTVEGAKVYDSADEVVLEKTAEDLDFTSIKAIDDMVQELGLDTVGVQLLYAVGAFNTDEENEEASEGDVVPQEGAEGEDSTVVSDGETMAEVPDVSGPDGGSKPLAGDMEDDKIDASEEDEQDEIEKSKKPRESVAKKVNEADDASRTFARVIFDNGGGVTLQAVDGNYVVFQHYYDSEKQAARDAIDIEQDASEVGSWDGNELEISDDGDFDQGSALDPTDDEIRNGGYRVYDSVADILETEDDPWGGNVKSFIDAVKKIRGSSANESTDKKWMQKAFSKHKGKLHKALGIDPDKEITVAQMKKALSDDKTKKMAQAAVNANPDKYKSLKEEIDFERQRIETAVWDLIADISEGYGLGDVDFTSEENAVVEAFSNMLDAHVKANNGKSVEEGKLPDFDKDGIGEITKKITEREFPTHVQDTLMAGITFEDIIDTVVSNEPVRDEKSVLKVFNEIYQANLADAKFLLKEKMPMILKAANEPDVDESTVSEGKIIDFGNANEEDIIKALREADEGEDETTDDFVKLISARAAKYVKEGEDIDAAIKKAMEEQSDFQDKVRGMIGGAEGGKELKAGLAAGIYKDAQSK